MHALGIPTTRSLAVVATGRPVRRETLLPGAVLARVASSHLRVGQLPVRPRPPATSTCCAASPTTRSPGTTRRPPTPSALPRAVRGGGRRPGVAGGAVDARRLRPRRHEHRQHDDLRRDHRLRPVRLHGGLRPGHGLQLDRRRAAATPTATSRSSPSGTSPGSPRRCCRSSTTTRSRRSRWRSSRSAGFRPQYDAAWSAGMRGQARPARRRSTTPWPPPLVDDLLGLLQAEPRRPHVVLPRPRRGRPRRRRAGPRPVPRPRRLRRLAASAGAPSGPTPTRWTGSTRSTSRATTSSRRRSTPRPAATSTRSSGSSTP